MPSAHRNHFTSLLTTLAAASLSSALSAQSQVVPAPAQSRPIAIVHAVVHTATPGAKPIADGHVVFDGGRILSVGAGMPELPANCEIVDAQGMHLSPGFCAFPSTLGLIETLQVEVTDDRRELGELRPEAMAAVAINPDSNLLDVARAAGILLSVSAPEGGLVGGAASAIRLDGWTPEDLTIDPSVGMMMTWPMIEPTRTLVSRRSPDEQRRRALEDVERIGRFFDEMKAILDARAADPTVAHDARATAMRDVLSGKDPVFIQVGSVAQIEHSVAWMKSRGLRPVILGGDGIESAIPFLKSEAVPVVVRGIHRRPGARHAPTDAAFSLPRKLSEAGIVYSISAAGEPAHERNLPHHAATAAAFGLDPDEALRAITATPCEIAGIGANYGTIEPLKSATLILTRGHPLEITSDVASAWIDGKSIDLQSHQSRMKAKYEEKLERIEKSAEKNAAPSPAAPPVPTR